MALFRASIDRSRIWGLLSFILFSSFFLADARADTLNVAVASNFTTTMRQLASAFHAETGHTLKLSNASTGTLYAQILHGAPFDVLMSADESYADKLIADGKADGTYSQIYALGKLVFISNIVPDGECRDVLYSSQLKHLAIANPSTAPYGRAAQQVMENLKVWIKLQPKLVMGENITQTLQFVASTSADAGFVAKSLLLSGTTIKRACDWEVPDDLYLPIQQKMVMLNQARKKPAAIAFWNFMGSSEAAVIIRDNGYDVP
jgi:molybdate transport system substrate-binding protein